MLFSSTCLKWAYSKLKVLKGQCHEIFCFWFFLLVSFPPSLEYPIRTVSNFFENSRRYLQVKVHHHYQRHRWQNCRRYQWHRRQILPPVLLVLLIPVAICHRCQRHQWQNMVTISGCRLLKVNLKAKIYIFVNSTTQRCPNKIIKNFCLKIFSICHRCQRHRWCTLSRENLRTFSKKFEMVMMVYLGDSWKKPEVENLVALTL